MPPHAASQRGAADRLGAVLARLRGVYSDNLIGLVEWCMALQPQARPQSALLLQKELACEQGCGCAGGGLPR